MKLIKRRRKTASLLLIRQRRRAQSSLVMQALHLAKIPPIICLKVIPMELVVPESKSLNEHLDKEIRARIYSLQMN